MAVNRQHPRKQKWPGHTVSLGLVLVGIALLFPPAGDCDQTTPAETTRTSDMPSTSIATPDEPAPEEINQPISSLLTSPLERKFHPIVLKAAQRHRIEPELVKAIIFAESGYNPKAVSSRGAKGLMQLMPKTAEALGVKDLFNPEQNINGGVRYLRQLVDEFEGNILLALAAYNAGGKHVRKYQGIPPFKATRFYIQKVISYYHFFKNSPRKSSPTPGKAGSS